MRDCPLYLIFMCDIKNYHTEEHSLSNGQVLMRNYTFEEAAVVVREMTDP